MMDALDPTRIPHLRQIDRRVERHAPADPMFPRAWDVLADRVAAPIAIVVGVPYGGGSLSGARCAEAPAAVRAGLARFSAYSSDFDVALDIASVLDAGDVDCAGDTEEVEKRVTECVAAIRERAAGVPLVVVGGDNSITTGAAAGADADALVTFDAHHDVRDGVSNGSPVRRLVDAGLPGRRIVQIGIHGFANSQAYAQRASSYGISWVAASVVHDRGVDDVVDQTIARLAQAGATRVWVDVDLDCLDRAFAPGTAAALPGGLHPRHLERAAFLLGASPLVAGMDLTELDPAADVADTTVRAACATLLAFVAGAKTR